MHATCPSCGFALASADTAAGPCPECGIDADGRAVLAHRSARAVRWAGAALGVVASLVLLNEVHRWAVRGILAVTTNDDSRAAILGELASYNRASVWVRLAEVALILAAGLIAWRAGALRRSPRGGLAWVLGGLAIALPAAQLAAMAIVVPASGQPVPPALSPGFLLWALAGSPWYAGCAGAAAAAWLACAPPVRRSRALAVSLWAAVLMLLVGSWLLGGLALGTGAAVGSGMMEAASQSATLSALAALVALRSWPHVHEPLPEHRPGDVVTLRHAMHMGGTVLGWALAMIGVLVWIVVRSRPVDLTGSGSEVLSRIPSWMVARDVLAMLLVAAWVIPAFLVPDPRAAKTWKLAALISGAAAVLFAGR